MLEEHIFTFSGEACNTGCIFCKSTFRPSSQRELILAHDDKPAPHYDDHHLKTHVGVDVDLRRGLACKPDELTRVEFPHNLRISISRWSIFDLALIFYQALINRWPILINLSSIADCSVINLSASILDQFLIDLWWLIYCLSVFFINLWLIYHQLLINLSPKISSASGFTTCFLKRSPEVYSSQFFFVEI